MTITITLEHSDIVGTEHGEIEALFCILQAYAKMTKGTSKNSLADARKANEEEMKESNNSANPAEEKETVEKSTETKPETTFDRKKIENEIKQIALEGKEKGISKKIKSIIQGYGFEKLNEVPDDKMQELLEKVKAL